MAQFGRPIADANNDGAWVNQAAGSTNLYQSIDETVASDTDYIESPLAPTSDVYVAQLTTTLEDPLTSSGHVVRWRQGKDAAGGATITLTVELRQGYVSEASQGTLIATCQSAGTVPDAFTNASYTLSGVEADAITNYGSLYLRFVANQA